MHVFDYGTPLLFDLIPAQTREKIDAVAQHLRLSDGQPVHLRGDTYKGFNIVRKGSVRVGRMLPDGRFLLLSVIGPGQFFGIRPGEQINQRTHDAFAIGPTEISRLSAAQCEALMTSDPALASAIMQIAFAVIARLSELYDDVRHLGPTERLGKLLLSARKNDAISYDVVALQSDLADILGMSAVTLSKSLRILEAQGFVKTAYRSIRVESADRLMRWLTEQQAF